jgi:bilin biosynthesis protein
LGDQIQKSDDLRAQNRVFQALDDISAEVRAEAVTLIGKSCDAEDVENMLSRKLVDQDTQVRKNTAMALMKLEAFNAIESIEAAKSTEKDESVQAVFNVAINILSRDLQEKQESE